MRLHRYCKGSDRWWGRRSDPGYDEQPIVLVQIQEEEW